MLAEIERRRGRLDAARDHLVRAADICDSLGEERYRSQHEALLGAVLQLVDFERAESSD